MNRVAPQPAGNDRSGVCAVEFAFIGPVLFLLLIGLSFIGLAAFRYIQLASVSRNAARWAATQTKRQSATNSPAITASDVYNAAILPNMLASDPDQLNWDVTWSADGRLVTVSLEYTQSPEAYFVGGTLRSQCTMFVSR
jgi:Flp pilus assembly protein TadG